MGNFSDVKMILHKNGETGFLIFNGSDLFTFYFFFKIIFGTKLEHKAGFLVLTFDLIMINEILRLWKLVKMKC